MSETTVTVYGPDGEILRTETIVVPDVPVLQTVTVDPQALTDAAAAVQAATTIAGLRAAVLNALDLLNPGT